MQLGIVQIFGIDFPPAPSRSAMGSHEEKKQRLSDNFLSNILLSILWPEPEIAGRTWWGNQDN